MDTMIQSYLSTCPFPAIIYRPVASSSRLQSDIDDSLGQKDFSVPFDLNGPPAFSNPAADRLMGTYPLLECVTATSRPGLTTAVKRLWETHTSPTSKESSRGFNNTPTTSGAAPGKHIPDKKKNGQASAAPPDSAIVTVIQLVGVRHDQPLETGESFFPNQQVNLERQSKLVPTGSSTSNEGHLRIVKWNIKLLRESSGGVLLVLTDCTGSIEILDDVLASSSLQESLVRGLRTPFIGSSGDLLGRKADISAVPGNSADTHGGSSVKYPYGDPKQAKVPTELLEKSHGIGFQLPKIELQRRPAGEVTDNKFRASHVVDQNIKTTSIEQLYSCVETLPPGVRANVDPSVLVRFAENAPIGIVCATPAAKIVWVNAMWYEVTGVKPGESFDSWIDHLAPEHLPMIMESISALIETRSVSNVDFMWKDGRWANFTSQCDFDVNGVFVGIVGCIRDSTKRHTELESLRQRELEAREMVKTMERRNSELAEAHLRNQKLEEEKNMFAQMAEMSTTGLTIGNTEGVISWANKAFFRIHGLEDTELMGWPRVVHPGDLEELTEKWQKARETLTALRSRHRLKNGRTVSATSIPDTRQVGNTRQTLYIGSITDVTNQVASEKAIQHMSDLRVNEAEVRRKEAIFQKEQQALLVDVVSHELRNAINPILQSSLLIRSSLIVARTKAEDAVKGTATLPITDRTFRILGEDIEACDAIVDSATQMERVANDVLGLAQIQLNQLDVTPVPFSLESQLKSINRMFQADCRAKDLELTVEMGPSTKLLGEQKLIKADPSRLQQTLVNLTSNALKFTAKQAIRRVKIRVDIGMRPPAEDAAIVPQEETLPESLADNSDIYLFVSVTDTGPGMTEEELAKLFKKFTQANEEIHVQMGGNGLGLFIAKQLCKLQGGRIEAISRKGGESSGSTFRFYIATKSVAAASLSSNSSTQTVLPSTTTAEGSDQAAQPLRILVVDDNVINRKTLARQLVMHKHKIDTAEDGQEALTAIYKAEKEDKSYDCILLDVNMPVMDGMTCTRRLRAQEAEAGTSPGYWIVGCTGNARPEQIETVLASGMNTVITKPYRLPMLLQAIRRPTEVRDNPSSA